MFPKLLEIKALENYTLWLKYDDGIEGKVDLGDFTKIGVFSVWQDYSFFKKAYITHSGGAIAWNEDLDICADSQYLKIRNLTFEELRSSNK
jgi:Protein of unknown function (DUF2442)